VKLLRALQEEEIVRIGTTKPIKINIRAIAATNKNPVHEVASGRFRPDLFHRLAAAILQLPPLRDRSGDLSLLIECLLEPINREGSSEPGFINKKLSPSASPGSTMPATSSSAVRGLLPCETPARTKNCR